MINVSASDAGLGMKTFGVYANLGSAAPFAKSFLAEASCNLGNTERYSRCPTTYSTSIGYSLAQGVNAMAMYPYDVNGWYQLPPQTWTEKVDSTPPELAMPTGSLYDDRASLRTDDAYALELSASDGSLASPSTMRSGVKQIDVFIDSDPEPIYSVQQTCAAPNGSCPLNPSTTPEATWTPQPDSLPVGNHTIKVVARDMLDQPSSERTFAISVASDDVPATSQDLCGANDTAAEDIVENVVALANPELIDTVGEDEFGDRNGDGWIATASCPAKFHAVIRNASATELQHFRGALQATGSVDLSRVEVLSAVYRKAT